MDYENDPHYSSSNWTSPPYPSQYGYDRINMPQPQMMPPTSSPSSQNPDLHQHQHQDWNNNNTWNQQAHSGRINEAVNSAFGETDRSSYLSPDVVSQITANVIQQLRTTGLDNIQGQQQQPQQQPQQQWTPPAPGAGNNYSQSPTSSHTGPEGTFNHQHYPPPPYQSSPHPSRPSPVFQSMERQGSRASQSSEHNPRPETRPSPLSNESTDTGTGMTTLEKIWGKLFEDGNPTKRLGQFLRGIAMHLIEDYPPGNILVVTPEKMQKFYEDTGIPTDPYPWEDIFDDRTSAISRLLRDVEAEHHLVQMRLDERPDIPGLTPRGFERWATLMIQTHPDKEFERLQKTVLNMPISNPDDKKERFPKEIPRSLFPERPDLELRRDIDQSIIKHCAVNLPPVTDEDIAAMHHAKSYVSPTVEDGDDEEDGGYGEDEDEEEAKTSGPIERERKPYSAQPGGGKTYDEAGPSRHRHTKSFPTSGRPRENSIPSAPGRRGELHNQDMHYARTGSAGSHHPAPISTSRTGRSRSSSRGMHPGGDYRHSEGDLPGHNGGPRYAAASDYYLNPPSTMPEIGEEGRRHRGFDEDKRLYESYREREREREKSKYHDHLPTRGTWIGEEDYYRGVGGGGPVGGGSDRYDHYYGYR